MLLRALQFYSASLASPQPHGAEQVGCTGMLPWERQFPGGWITETSVIPAGLDAVAASALWPTGCGTELQTYSWHGNASRAWASGVISTDPGKSRQVKRLLESKRTGGSLAVEYNHNCCKSNNYNNIKEVIMEKAKEPLHGAAGRIVKSLQHNLLAQSKMGQSRHAAKQAAREAYLVEHGDLRDWNPAKTEGIYSRGTMDTYLHLVDYFGRWCAEQGAKRLADVTEDMARDYLRYLSEKESSPWTVSTAASAINKAMGWEIYPTDLGLPHRRKEDITRSRLRRPHDSRNFDRDQNQMTVAKATGVRRMSITRMTPDDCVRVAGTGEVVGIRVREKGGRWRVAPVLEQYRKNVTEIVDQAMTARGAAVPIFDSYDIHIDNHAFRGNYSAELLLQLKRKREAEQALLGDGLRAEDYIHLKGKDQRRKPQTQGYDTDLMACVSGALGHNRISVYTTYYKYALDRMETEERQKTREPRPATEKNP